MANIILHKEYDSSGESVQDLFDSIEEGFFVPLYQREYTWEEDNINQLFDDLVMGVRELSEENENATTFLGTTILTTLGDKKQTVKIGEERAQPLGVQIVIDGQQRISTLSLISIQIIIKLNRLLEKLPPKDPYIDLHNVGKDFIKRLRRLHAIELGKGANPPQKPKIIRARDDRWTYDGDDTAYGSPVAHYIATFIRTKDSNKAIEAINNDNGTRVHSNVKLIDEWLDAICDAHISGTNTYDQFPVGASIISSQLQEYVLGFTSDGVKSTVEKTETNKTYNDYYAAATYQLLLLIYYLLKRCGVNRLQPSREEWGFDMFQALNATGTPLTVMETFLPQVMQAEIAAGNDWRKTLSCELINEIQDLFDATTTNEQKNKRTNDLFSTFALCYEGRKLGNKFSEQRRWLTRSYEKQLTTINEKREFIDNIARTANFFYFGWYMEETTTSYLINGIEKYPEGELVSLLVRYLRDASSSLSVPILARFYSQAIGERSTAYEFIECVKACAAFFTLWRSANSTLGLPEIYRKYFRGSVAPIAVEAHNLKEHPMLVKSKTLKQYFLDVLSHRGIAKKEEWINASERFLLYTELKAICRFILFIASHDRVADEANPGLTDLGVRGSCTLLNLERWVAKGHKSLEHIAPQNPPAGHKWDTAIYEKNLVHHVGNLMLLPIEVNNHVDQKEWAVKYLHYCHLGEASMKNLNKLRDDAEKKGIVLSKKAANALSKVEYSRTMEPILSVGEDGTWNAKLIKSRTRQIKELAWEKLIFWLES